MHMGKLAVIGLTLIVGIIIAVGLLLLPGYLPTGQAATGESLMPEASQDAEPVEKPKWDPGPAFEPDPDYVVNDSVELTGETVTFVVTGENFKFLMDGEENPDLNVKLGDKVRIEFTSTDGFHDFVIWDFNAGTERVWATNSTSVEFIADKAGTFEYYCSVGQHRDMGMKGNLIVE